MRLVMIVATIFGISITAHAQSCDADIARAKEKLKSGLKDQAGPPAKPSIRSDFTMADYNGFHEMTLRMRPVGFDLAGFIMNPPTPGGLEAGLRTQDCMIRLTGTFDIIQASFDEISTMVGLAARMVDPQDRLLVTNLLGTHVSTFLANVKEYRTLLGSTAIKCSQDGATVAKGQEITHLLNDATALVQSAAMRMGVTPRQ